MTEGEKDADKLKENGLIATNHKNWKPEFNYLLKGKDVVIFADHDKPGIELAKKTARMIFPDAKAVKIVDCFEGEPIPEKHGRDVSGWLELGHTKDELLKIIQNAQNFDLSENEKTKPEIQFKFTALDDLLSEPEESHSYLWENTLIFGGLSICSAKPKVGKSTLARNLAVSVTQGSDFLGRATHKGKVIYLCLEEKRSEIAKLFRLMNATGKDILIHTGATPENVLRALEFAIVEIEPVLAIIDPLSRALRVNDYNDYASMARGLEPFIDIARKTNVHIIALHHEGKGGRDGGDALLGSTALFGAVDCHIQLKKRDKGRTVSSTQRYGVDLAETVIELDADTGIIAEKGDLQTFIMQEKQAEILDAITESERITEGDIKERVGGNSKGIVSKAIRALCEDKRLFRSGEGKKNNPYLYSKNPENLTNLENPESTNLGNEKPRINTDKNEAKSNIEDSRFLGFSNSKNPENLENESHAKFVDMEI
jgi:hypothetical protein